MTSNTENNPPPAERTVLVIGGAGYVGTELCRQLLGGGYQVRILDSLIYGHGHAIRQFLSNQNFEFILGDIRSEKEVGAALNGASDVIVLAGLVGDPICKKFPELARDVNLTSIKRAIDQCVGASINRLIFASTCSNYGLRDTDNPASEDAALNPVSLYAECKVAVEQHILEHAGTFDFTTTVLRIATAYGFSQRMRFDLTISEFTRELASGRDLLVYDEDTWRPYCHISDLSRAMIMVLEAPADIVSGEVFNIGNDAENFTKKMIVELIQGHLPDAEVVFKIGGVDPRNYRVSFDKAIAKLGFKNAYSVNAEIPKLIDAVQSGLFTGDDQNPNAYGNYEIRDN